MLGLESGTVRVVPADVRWSNLFAEEAARVRQVLARHGVELALEHTGSTAVPGLAAKPIIDILGGHAPGVSRRAVITAIEDAGYQHRGEQGIPGRDFFRRGTPRSYHLHLVETGSGFWRDHLTFRDYLRAHPERSAAYGALKVALAERYPRDREAYIEGKTAFVVETLRLATERSAV
jgi:GrpB-like predicted nucleotidyltransferase (UPF0157 family)